MEKKNPCAERVAELRRVMAEKGAAACLIPTADPHDSEYVDRHFMCRRWLSGFTGSAGTCVVTRDFAGLWTDGRYFVQAAGELKGSGIRLMKMGEPGVPTVTEFLAKTLKDGDVLAFDGKTLTEAYVEELEEHMPGVRMNPDVDLVGQIWKDRPPMPDGKVWILDGKYAGKSASEKLADLRAEMAEMGAGVHVLTTLDDIAWLFNIRGGDILYTPVVLAYALITQRDAILFADPAKFPVDVRGYLSACGVELRGYDEIYRTLPGILGASILMEKGRVNSRLWRSVDPGCRIIDAMNPTSRQKAVKNPTEVKNMAACHRKDAVAMIRFIRYLKENVGKTEIDEFQAARLLDGYRAELPGNLGPSFATISAYADNAAMCHYQAAEHTAKKLMPRGLYLVDSGGQYYEGTTDITRTFALGPVTAEEKKYYTLVLASHLHLMSAVCPAGARGFILDYAAREPLWKMGLDFNHGTGHGVGYLGTVHERPNAFRWRVQEKLMDQNNGILAPGMITSDEPGLYIEGVCGIRTESLLLCEEREKTDFGTFLGFSPLTLVPIDKEPIDTDYLTDDDIRQLNAYHERVYREIAPLLGEEDRSWLREATSALVRK